MKSINSKNLDIIQNLVDRELKENNFRKAGRTYNRTIEKGLIQVINFQLGTRGMEGQFTINLGVYIEELDEINTPNNKSLKKEYECGIRVRLSELTDNDDSWIQLREINHNIIANKIITDLNNEGATWFKYFNSRKKIIENLQKQSIGNFKNRTRAKLDAALILLKINKEEGVKIFKDYFNSISDNVPHKNYVAKLANTHNIEIQYDITDNNDEFLKSLLQN